MRRWFPSVGPANDTSPSWGPAAAPSNALQVTSPVPTDVTLSLTYTCPNGQTYPVATDVPESQIDAVSATFFAGFDPTTSCGGASGTLKATATDGLTISAPVAIGTFTPAPKPPQPSIDGPLGNTFFGPGSVVVLSGGATSPQGDAPAIVWTLTKGATTVPVGTGQQISLGGGTIPAAFRQPSGSWQPGAYTATLTATDAGSRTALATVQFMVLAPPTVAVTGVVDGAVYAAGGVPAPDCATTDAGGGIGSDATLSVSGGAFGAAGAHTATCSGATDTGGDPSAPVSASYTALAVPTVSVTGVTNGATYCPWLGACGGLRRDDRARDRAGGDLADADHSAAAP